MRDKNLPDERRHASQIFPKINFARDENVCGSVHPLNHGGGSDQGFE
jgi:hypothetical protein